MQELCLLRPSRKRSSVEPVLCVNEVNPSESIARFNVVYKCVELKCKGDLSLAEIIENLSNDNVSEREIETCWTLAVRHTQFNIAKLFKCCHVMYLQSYLSVN